jgi:hypothetical protein
MATPKDMTVGSILNTKNGDVEVVRYVNKDKVFFKFINSGFETSSKSQAIREGRVTDRLSKTVLGIATIGDGPYKNTINYKTTPAYKCWIGIIYRCYYEKCSSFHRYGGRGVFVCEEWLNFQTFAGWYEKNKPCDSVNWEIDKDIKVKGNLEYSPDKCIFVSPQQNTENAIAKTFKMKSPSGKVVEFYNMAKFCRENGLTKGGLHRVYTGGRNTHRGWKRAE